MKDRRNANWSVYLIKTALDTFYCGVTTDVQRRFSEHQSNGAKCAKYLKGKHPLTLVWCYFVGNKQRTFVFEYQIKKLNRKNKIRLINESDYIERLCQQIK